MIKNLILTIAFLLASAHIASAETVVYIQQTIPFASGSLIKYGVNNCNLGDQLSGSIESAGNNAGSEINIKRDDNAVQEGSSLVLKLAIVEAAAEPSHVAVSGSLFKNGIEIGNFTGYRHTATIKFIKQCKLLARCTSALSKDIVKWLKNPGFNSKIGE
jgi:hypothetical protein